MPLTSHIYKLSGDVEIFFTNTGAPPNAAYYTTVIILYGAVFNGQNFTNTPTPLHTRVALWNRREYSGSTKYIEAELKELADGQTVFLN
ncbi:hypothetical protein AAF712_007356 [Marasmius tenuissimus]|uniref:Uncharacterized protein n=1 Tax=Marasmius tenuissimus TaxID=585030 RepID=A0ABR2ZW44_9AGAR